MIKMLSFYSFVYEWESNGSTYYSYIDKSEKFYIDILHFIFFFRINN